MPSYAHIPGSSSSCDYNNALLHMPNYAHIPESGSSSSRDYNNPLLHMAGHAHIPGSSSSRDFSERDGRRVPLLFVFLLNIKYIYFIYEVVMPCYRSSGGKIGKGLKKLVWT